MNRSVLPIALGLLLAVDVHAALAAGVWKCKDGERTVFSDTPCPAQGTQIEARLLQPNLMQAEKIPPKAAAGAAKPGQTQSKRARLAARLKKRSGPVAAVK